MKDERKLFIEQTDQLLTVLNQQRHDWLNHFQVLLGYLRLGRPEQGEEYLKRVAALASQESSIAQINCSPLSIFFLTFNALHKDLLLEVEVSNQVDLSLAAMERTDMFQFVTDVVFTVKENVVKDPFEMANILISLADTENGIQLRFDVAGSLHESGNRELEKLVESSKQVAMTVTEWIVSDAEWVLEVTFPLAERER